jgi:hypothetical protein
MTSQDLIQILINFVAVAGGLFVLWSFVGRMRELPIGTRAGFAATAGGFAAVATLIVTWIVRASTAGAPAA